MNKIYDLEKQKLQRAESSFRLGAIERIILLKAKIKRNEAWVNKVELEERLYIAYYKLLLLSEKEFRF